ncbi:hypothetical protein EJB05_46825 [Eragrostis curvula]|uniref:Uncharacterized protein n=1 Tax=Eragrostis curvula TaxID=38414 RepID=A0A5J9T899_9POAL|nr:hypothetical protein EJB05_46825 [Eragrostis curvula]
MDEEGSKMEAMAFGKACFTTNQGISEGEVYNFTNVIGVIVYVSDVQGEDNSRLQRRKYVAIMDSRGNMITVHVRGTKFFQNSDGWREQETVFQTMAAVNDFRTIYSEIDNEHNVSHVNAC